MKINALQIISDLRIIANEFRSKREERMQRIMDPGVKDDSAGYGFTVMANCRCLARLTHVNMSWRVVVTMSDDQLTLLDAQLGRHTHSIWALASAADKMEVMIRDMLAHDSHLALQIGEPPLHALGKSLADGQMSEISETIEVAAPEPPSHVATPEERREEASDGSAPRPQGTSAALPEQPVQVAQPEAPRPHERPTRTLELVATWKVVAELRQILTVHVPNAPLESVVSDEALAAYIGEEDLHHEFVPGFDLSERGMILNCHTDAFTWAFNHQGLEPDRTITVMPCDDACDEEEAG